MMAASTPAASISLSRSSLEKVTTCRWFGLVGLLLAQMWTCASTICMRSPPERDVRRRRPRKDTAGRACTLGRGPGRRHQGAAVFAELRLGDDLRDTQVEVERLAGERVVQAQDHGFVAHFLDGDE